MDLRTNGTGMGRNTTERLAVTPETKSLIDDEKPDGVTYDFYLRHAVSHAPPLGDQ